MDDKLDQLIAIVKELNFSIAMPMQKEEDEFIGMIIGTEEYIDSILAHLPEDMFTKN